MISGEPIPVAQANPDDEVVGRHGQPDGGLPLSGNPRGRRHAARPDHPHGRGGASRQAADSAAGRPHRRRVRAHRHGRGVDHLRRLAAVRAGTGAQLCLRRRRERPADRLPVRDGPRHPDGHYGCDRARRRHGHPVPPRSGPGSSGAGGHPGARQDRDDHAGQAGTDRVRALGMAEDEALALVAAVERYSEHPIAGAIVRAAQGTGTRHP